MALQKIPLELVAGGDRAGCAHAEGKRWCAACNGLCVRGAAEPLPQGDDYE